MASKRANETRGLTGADVSDLQVIADNTVAVTKAMQRQLAAALESVGLLAERHAKEKCPVDTGRLRNSITHAVEDGAAYVGTNVEYAAAVELGTKRQKAQPYLVPAATNHTAEYRRAIESALRS